MIYFTSDQHFFYRKSRTKAPAVGTTVFATPEEKNQYMIHRWNETVSPEDEVYILGDFSDGSAAETESVLKQLNGIKYLIIGNNDHYLEDPAFDRSLFVWCQTYFELWANDQKHVLFHFPIEVWSGSRNNRIHLHGHMHSLNAISLPIRRYDVGVDAHDGRPVSIEEADGAVDGFDNQRVGERIDRGK